MSYQDILFEANAGAVVITINRPEVHNAFRAVTCEELVDALRRAAWDKSVGVIVLTGAGGKAFCTGGDQKSHGADGYGGRGTIGLPIEELHSAIRDAPKPVIAKVRGYCIGGGNVLATLCDLTLASETAVFGQVGPKVGSVDPGFGTAYLARVVGEKKGAGNVVLVPPLSGARGARHGPHQRRRSGRSARRGGRALVSPKSSHAARRQSRSRNNRSMPTASTSAASPH